MRAQDSESVLHREMRRRRRETQKGAISPFRHGTMLEPVSSRERRASSDVILLPDEREDDAAVLPVRR